MNSPKPATAEQLRDYFDGHVKAGRADSAVLIDRRGLQYLGEHHDPGLGVPPDNETHSADGRVFLRAVF